MASSHASTADSINFSSFIEDDPQVTGDTTQEDNVVSESFTSRVGYTNATQLLVQADASITREETANGSRHASESLDDARKPPIASEEASERRGSSHSSETISSGSTVFLHPEESGQGVPDPVKTPVSPSLILWYSLINVYSKSRHLLETGTAAPVLRLVLALRMSSNPISHR